MHMEVEPFLDRHRFRRPYEYWHGPEFSRGFVDAGVGPASITCRPRFVEEQRLRPSRLIVNMGDLAPDCTMPTCASLCWLAGVDHDPVLAITCRVLVAARTPHPLQQSCIHAPRKGATVPKWRWKDGRGTDLDPNGLGEVEMWE